MHRSADTEGSARISGPVAFEGFYQSNYRQVLRLAYTMSGSWAVAEDLTHEAFEAAYRRWTEVGTYERSEAWVRQVVVNKARSRLRRVYREAALTLRMRPVAVHVDLPESNEEFWRTLRTLSPKQAAALALFYLEGRSTEEIGEVLGCSGSTARVHLHNGRKALAARLGIEEEV
jgi:RNA polymerase sigma-70 factor (ECF subfamily)